MVVYTTAGAMIGYVATLLRRAEHQISAARAREEVARTLHDGVLQTLAVVQRRADDPALARLAREQERELREYLFGTAAGRAAASRGRPRRRAPSAAAGRFEDTFGGRAQVVRRRRPAPRSTTHDVDALAGAVGEALTNAGKHGGARASPCIVEPADDGGVFCSVKDDGSGFDTGRGDRRGRPGTVDPGTDDRGGRHGSRSRQPGTGATGSREPRGTCCG